ncbi:TorD/DmsD family molecular chaperone [Berryella wangjianweii]|nr:molecular chaperone TorD family protein [Berryella wangjianweii]
MASRLADREAASIDVVAEAAMEYTRLFVGPPRPEVCPWETMYRGEMTQIGFGSATQEMRALLRESGLELRNENNQYEDHMGIELLYLSILCGRAADRLSETDAVAANAAIELAVGFCMTHPAQWIDKLAEAAQVAAPDGYFASLLNVCVVFLKEFQKFAHEAPNS